MTTKSSDMSVKRIWHHFFTSRAHRNNKAKLYDISDRSRHCSIRYQYLENFCHLLYRFATKRIQKKAIEKYETWRKLKLVIFVVAVYYIYTPQRFLSARLLRCRLCLWRFQKLFWQAPSCHSICYAPLFSVSSVIGNKHCGIDVKFARHKKSDLKSACKDSDNLASCFHKAKQPWN